MKFGYCATCSEKLRVTRVTRSTIDATRSMVCATCSTKSLSHEISHERYMLLVAYEATGSMLPVASATPNIATPSIPATGSSDKNVTVLPVAGELDSLMRKLLPVTGDDDEEPEPCDEWGNPL